MIKLLGSVPQQVTVAVSGGVDSMALLNFLANKHDVKAAFFHHGTENSERAEHFITDYCTKNNIELTVGHITESRDSNKSPEEFWREQRYKFLNGLNCLIASAHNLDDCVETWIWSSLHGQSKLIPYMRGCVFRPFLLTQKKVLIDWCIRKNVPWIEDSSNSDTRYTRNYIRHELMPHALKVNPGLCKLIRKKLVDRQKLNS